ncbi:MAG: DUF2752 domain-containing protein [Prevotella sp.]|nr:DUF2752 domain-containing protein [Prevotella sp.]
MTINKKRITFILGAVVIVVAAALYYWIDPAESGYAPKCIFHSLTGLSCPGCGMQRFLHALFHGRLLEAFSYNYLLIVFIPYIILYGINRFLLKGERQEQIERILEGRALTLTMVILTPTWFIVRNIFHI